MAERTAAYRRKTANERKQDLVAAGISCLGKGGISAFTIDRICKEAKVSRGLINHHFKTKEELLVRIYADMTAHLVDELPATDAAAQLLAIIDSSFDASSFNRSNLRAWLAIWAEVGNNEALNDLHRSRYRRYAARISAAIDEIAKVSRIELDAASLARQMIALIDGLWLEYCLHSDSFSLAEARRDCIDLLAANGIGLDSAAGDGRH